MGLQEIQAHLAKQEKMENQGLLGKWARMANRGKMAGRVTKERLGLLEEMAVTG